METESTGADASSQFVGTSSACLEENTEPQMSHETREPMMAQHVTEEFHTHTTRHGQEGLEIVSSRSITTDEYASGTITCPTDTTQISGDHQDHSNETNSVSMQDDVEQRSINATEPSMQTAQSSELKSEVMSDSDFSGAVQTEEKCDSVESRPPEITTLSATLEPSSHHSAIVVAQDSSFTPHTDTGGETPVRKQSRKRVRGKIRAHPLLPPCNCSRLQCSERIGEEERKQIHSAFWQLKNLTERRQWILDHMQRQLINVTCRKWIGTRTENRTFFLPDAHGKLLKVCKRFFLKTLGFQYDSVLKALMHSTPLTVHTASPDLRGRRLSRHRVPGTVLVLLKKHVQSKLDSSKFSKQFNSLRAKVNGCGFVQMCYRDFQVKYPAQDVSYQVYQNVFLEESKAMVKAARVRTTSDFYLLNKAHSQYNGMLQHPNMNDSGDFAVPADIMPQTSQRFERSVQPSSAKDSDQQFDKRNNAVIMQLDSESDAIIITRNVSDSESDSEAQEHREHSSQKSRSLSAENEGSRSSVPEEATQFSDGGNPENTAGSSRWKTDYLKERCPLQPPCNCERRCFEKVDEERRKEIHDMFWSLGDLTKQKHWIQRQRVVSKPDTLWTSPLARTYRLTNRDGALVQVCRHHFMSTIGLVSDSTETEKRQFAETEKRQFAEMEKRQFAETSIVNPAVKSRKPHMSKRKGTNPPAKRHQGPIKRKLEDFVVSAIVEHIQDFIHSGKNIPGLGREESSNVKGNKVTIKEMHQDFLSMHPDLSISYAAYYKFFHEQINNFKAELYAGSLKEDRAHCGSGIMGEINCSEADAIKTENMSSDYPEPDGSFHGAQDNPDSNSLKKRSVRNSRRSVNYSESQDLPLYQEYYIAPKKRLALKHRNAVKTLKERLKAAKSRGSVTGMVSSSGNILSPYEMTSSAHVSGESGMEVNQTIAPTSKRKRGRPRKHPYPERVDFNDDRDMDEEDFNDPFLQKGKDLYRKSYVVSSAKKRSKHPILPACKCNRRKCFEKIPESRRVEIHQSYWNLKSYTERKQWMCKYVQRWEQRSRKLPLTPPGRRNDCRRYFLPESDDKSIEVCRVFFLHTLGFKWDRIVDEIIKTVPKDEMVINKAFRELKKPQRKMPEIVIKSVKEFWEKSLKEDAEREEPNPDPTADTSVNKGESETAKVRRIFEAYRAAHKNIYLGYNNFRRILRELYHDQSPFITAESVAETVYRAYSQAVDRGQSKSVDNAQSKPSNTVQGKSVKKTSLKSEGKGLSKPVGKQSSKAPVDSVDEMESEAEAWDELPSGSESEWESRPPKKKVVAKKKKSIKPKVSRRTDDFCRSYKKVPAAVMKAVKEFWESVQESTSPEPVRKKSNRGRKRKHEDREPAIPEGMKVKELFIDFRAKNKSIYLGYHNFRRIMRNLAGMRSGASQAEEEIIQDEDEPAKELKKAKRKLPEVVVKSVRDFWESSPMAETAGADRESVLSMIKTYSKSPFMPGGIDIKKLFTEYRAKHTNIYLGYHNFRRILRSVLNPDLEPLEILEPSEKKRPAKKATSSSRKDSNDPSSSKQNDGAEAGMAADSLEREHDTSSGFYSAFEMFQNELRNSDDCILDVGSGILKQKHGAPAAINSQNLTVTGGSYKYKKRRHPSMRNNKINYPMLPPCNCTKRKCLEKIPEVHRKEIYEKFWNLAGYNERKQWMLEHIERTDIKRRVVFYDEGKPKKHESRWYYLPDPEGHKVEVCKAFFLRTLGYKWDSVIDTIGKTTPKGEKIAAPDRRGRRPPSHKISEEAIGSMAQYIESICQTSRSWQPQKGQKKSKTPNMIPYGLTMKHLFEDYKSKHPNHRYGYESFRKVFRKVKANWLQSLPQEYFQDEPEPSYPAENDSAGHDYLDVDAAENANGFQTESSQMVQHVPQTAPSYPGIEQYNSSHDNLPHDAVPERRSCLYQYSPTSLNPIHNSSNQPHHLHNRGSHSQHHLHPHQQEPPPLPPPHQLPVHDVQVSHNSGGEHYRPMDNEHFMKYNLYNGASATNPAPGGSGHFQPVPDPMPFNPSSRPEMDPSTSSGNQFPPYLMPDSEPFRRQVYHQMATQYHSILHHIAESNRFFNYSSFPPSSEGNFQMGQEKLAPFGNRQDFPRDMQNQNNFPPLKSSHGYVQEGMPMQNQFIDPNFTEPNFQQQDGSSVDLASYSDDNEGSFLPDNSDLLRKGQGESPHLLTSLQTPENEKGKSGKKSSSRKKSGENKVKVRRERKIKVKSARNHGEHYPLLPPCNCKKKKCSEKFPEDKRQQLHDMYWSLGNYNVRKQWMLERIERTDPKRRREIIGTLRKGESRWYFLPDDDGQNVEVCKTFFLHTLGYKWDSVIDTIRRTTPKGEKVSKPDQRGRKPPAHKLPASVIRSVIQYIESMQQASEPFQPKTKEVKNETSGDVLTNSDSAGTSQIVIPYGLTMKDLFDDYKAKHAGHKLGYESFRRLYRAVANSEQILMDDDDTGEELLNPDGDKIITF